MQHVSLGSATYGPRAGPGPPSKIIRPAASLPMCSNCKDPLVVLHFMNLPSLPYLLLKTYEELLMKNRTAQELIWLKVHKFPRFNSSKGNGIVGGKLARPAVRCRVCIWPGTRERLPTPDVSASYWSACICSTIGKHTLACNRHEIEWFLLQESTDQKCLWVCLLHSIAISLVSEYHHHPSMMHLSTHQDISFGQKIVHVHHLEKYLMEQIVYTFMGKKEHHLFCCN